MLCCAHLDELKKYDARPIVHCTLFLLREKKRLVEERWMGLFFFTLQTNPWQ